MKDAVGVVVSVIVGLVVIGAFIFAITMEFRGYCVSEYTCTAYRCPKAFVARNDCAL